MLSTLSKPVTLIQVSWVLNEYQILISGNSANALITMIIFAEVRSPGVRGPASLHVRIGCVECERCAAEKPSARWQCQQMGHI